MSSLAILFERFRVLLALISCQTDGNGEEIRTLESTAGSSWMASEIYRVNGHWVVTKWSANAVCDTRKPPKIVQSLDSSHWTPTSRLSELIFDLRHMQASWVFLIFAAMKYRAIDLLIRRLKEASLKNLWSPLSDLNELSTCAFKMFVLLQCWMQFFQQHPLQCPLQCCLQCSPALLIHSVDAQWFSMLTRSWRVAGVLSPLFNICLHKLFAPRYRPAATC